MKKKMPKNEIRFCIAGALYPRYRKTHATNHFRSEFGKYRQRQAFPGGLFAVWEVTGAIPEKLKALLQVKRNPVVHLASDSLPFQVVHQGIPPGMADHELVVHMPSVPLGREPDSRPE